jgi:hypothetical protein
MEEPNCDMEKIEVAANQLVDRVKELIKEGRTRRVTIKKGDHVYMEIPLTVGISGAMATIWLAPVLAAVGAIAALVSDVELVVERTEEAESTEV